MSSNAAAQPSKKTLLSLAFGKDCIRHEEGKEKKRKRERKKERKKERERERKKCSFTTVLRTSHHNHKFDIS